MIEHSGLNSLNTEKSEGTKNIEFWYKFAETFAGHRRPHVLVLVPGLINTSSKWLV